MNPFAAAGYGALDRLIGNVSDAYGSGAMLRHVQQGEEIDQRYKLNYADMMSRVEAAKAAGLHPTMGLGVNIAGSGGWQGAMPIDSASHRRASNDSALNDKQAALLDSQIKETESRTALNQWELSQKQLASQPGQPPLQRQDVIIEPVRLPASRAGGSLTAGQGPANTEVLVRLPNGEVVPQTMFGNQQEDEISQYINLISRNTGISPSTIEFMASIGLLAVPFGVAGRLAYSGYKGYKAAQAAKSAARAFKPFRPTK